MKYNELIKAFNRDVLVRGQKIQFTGNKGDRIEHRDSLLRTYTGTFELTDAVVGIRAESHPAQGHLIITWCTNAIRDVNGKLLAIEYRNMTPAELNAVAEVKHVIDNIMRSNLDVDEALGELGFVKYTQEDVA